MFLPLMISNTILLVSVISFVILSIAPYTMAKSKYDYNIYNIGNVGIIFGGMVSLYLIIIVTGGMEDYKQSLFLIGIVIFVTVAIVFFRTLKNTNIIIAILAIIPQIFISIIIYLITKLIYNIIFKSEY